ncbi:MAG: hypothetical protein HY297_00500 [Thaumarchaeota archaeon]|nr:hypothetical protein [Nitrososphaerota archaeon]
MQRSQFLGLFVLALMVLAAVPLQVSVASTTYSEKLSISIAGSDALWYLTMGNVNGSSRLSTLESVPGLSWYNVTAIKTTAWKSDFQLFGPSGYDLLPTPFIPSQGLFLTVGADSFSSAAAAARGLDSYLLSAFVSFSNDTGSYTFYSPVSFDTIVPRTLLTFLPTGAGGFANAITSSGWIGTASPVIVLGGVRAGSGFNHSLVVGSITATAIDATTKRPSILNYFGSTITSLQASNRSTSSSIAIKFLDGLINSSDPATVNNDRAAFMGSYTLTVAPREHIYRLNVTAMQQPALLLAYRTVNTGVLHAGDNLSVTISLSNLSNDTALQSVSFADDWWKSSNQFTLVSGNSTFSNPSMAAGVRLTPVYTLHFNGSASQRITIPAIAVGYSFKVGQLTSQGHSSLNAIPLSLGADDAVVYARVVPLGGYGKVVGAEQKVKVIATNVGTFAASSVVVAGQDVSGLAANGGSATVEVTE